MSMPMSMVMQADVAARDRIVDPADAAPPIGAIRGGPGTGASDVLTAFARARMAEGVVVAGLVVAPAPDGTRRGGPHGHGHGHGHGGHGHEACGCGGALRDLATGEVIEIHQDLGPGSEACSLDTSGLARACAGIERQIAAGVDLVILSRFGGQEAERGGLTAAFQAAVAANVPVVCVVTPKAEAAWAEFAGDLALLLPPDLDAVEAWWRDQRAARGRTAG
ncbi:DUF2478 domain-containing protein [Rhodoplanes sp. TEM]|uniref:DUF2478 domain-containing protein n=1 Tax=Rhodoplanes tepidamans TaxID=200616 RepID=A0ABT5JIJ4_RHOTP|nr:MULTISPECIES: DUF2478 domain-containing protein [Rhodoplanes]MDC7789523.1 DUF2478 domain-containing protein [Rhodoplanes tepidamans]MDC7987719.1 DUF2478 domain-containing protein [Rhodoplanes sp. TEM]MDQ0354013.1 hypothetical protein [Rhodoplanes tepidamans]